MNLPKDEHIKLKLWAVEHNTTLQEVFHEALKMWMAAKLGKHAKVGAK